MDAKILANLIKMEKAASPAPWEMDCDDSRDADLVHCIMYNSDKSDGKPIFDSSNSEDRVVFDESDQESGPHYRDDVAFNNFLFIRSLRNHAKELFRLAEMTRELQRKIDQDSEMAMQTLRERDDAEQALSQAYYLVVGRSPEWSSTWHHQECLDEIKDACTILRRERQRLEDENLKLRKIAAHVPGDVYIKAKEAAGFGEAIRTCGK